MKKQDLYIGMPVYNRKHLIKLLSKNWEDAGFFSGEYNFNIFDDNSNEFTKEELIDLIYESTNNDFFKTNSDKIIKRNSQNIKADMNTINIFKDFINSSCKYILIFDSDLIIHKNFFDVLSTLIDKTQGVITLYNSFFHLTEEYNDELCIKKDAGFAGLVIRKDILQKFLYYAENKKMKFNFGPLTDWGLSEFLEKHDIKIFCVKNSLIQHLGISGQHCSLYSYDYSSNFIVQENEAQIINDSFVPTETNYSFSNNIILFIDKIFPLLKILRRIAPPPNERKFLQKVIQEYQFIKKIQNAMELKEK